jgi:hypothetical protein
MSLFGNVHPENERAKALGHSGIQVGEIIAYRAWRVGRQGCLQPRRDLWPGPLESLATSPSNFSRIRKQPAGSPRLVCRNRPSSCD